MRSKLPNVGTTIFTTMSELARDHGAVNLAQGFPDFAAPDALLARVSWHLQAGHNQYAPMAGLYELREQISRKAHRSYGQPIDPELCVTVTSGATEALFSAIMATVGTGDEVIVFDPAYDSYGPAIRLAGGTDIHIPLVPGSFAIDWNRVEAALSPRTRLIILNSPHNPSGAVLQAQDIEALKQLLQRSDCLILSDEVYEHMVFDGQPHLSMLGDTQLAGRSLVVGSFGKTFHTTGWKIGYCIAPEALMREFRRVHQFVQFCVVTPMQHAIAEFLHAHPEHWQQLSAFYQDKRDCFAALLQTSRFSLQTTAGTYFQLLDYSAISTASDVEFTRWMTVEKGVAAIPISVFYDSPPDQQLIRLCFAKDTPTLEKAAEILCAI